MIVLAALYIVAASRVQRLAAPIYESHSHTVCAHRGRIDSTQLENSVSNIRRTVSRGVVMVEVDLAESRDKTIYLLHDRTLDRTTDGMGAIHNLTDSQLSRVFQKDLLTGLPVEHMSTFDQLLRWDVHRGLRILVDIKDTPPNDALTEIRRYGLVKKVILLTFDRQTAERAYAADGQVTVSVLVHTRAEIDEAIEAAHGHPTALYVARESSPDVFRYANTRANTVITDSLGTIDREVDHLLQKGTSIRSSHCGAYKLYADFFRTHPVSVLVTDHALLAAAGDCK